MRKNSNFKPPRPPGAPPRGARKRSSSKPPRPSGPPPPGTMRKRTSSKPPRPPGRPPPGAKPVKPPHPFAGGRSPPRVPGRPPPGAKRPSDVESGKPPAGKALPPPGAATAGRRGPRGVPPTKINLSGFQKCRMIIEELVTTEEHYVRDLNALCSVYVDPLDPKLDPVLSKTIGSGNATAGTNQSDAPKMIKRRTLSMNILGMGNKRRNTLR